MTRSCDIPALPDQWWGCRYCSTAARILAGQEAARAAGKVWGGGKPGRRVRLSVEKEKAICQLSRQGKGISEIARVVGLSRPTVYKALG